MQTPVFSPDGVYIVEHPEDASQQDIVSYAQNNGKPLSHQRLSVLRSKNDALGKKLRKHARKPLSGESETQTFRRLYGGVTQEPYTGGILPISSDKYGDPSIDWDAGLPGMAKRVFQLPRQAMEGEFDPTEKSSIPRMLEAGAAMTPMGAATRVQSSIFAPKSAYKQVAPSRADLKTATDAGYAEARSLGAEYTPASIKQWADETVEMLDGKGWIAENYSEVHSLLNKLREVPENATSINLESIDALYKALGKLAGDKDKGFVASAVQKNLDDFHANLDPSALVAGTATPAKAAEVLKKARGTAAAGFRSDRVTDVEQTIGRRTAAANSGRNLDNTIRQRLTSLIESQKGSRGLTKQEELAIDDIIFGKPTKNSARMVSNLLGGGGGVGTTALSGLLGIGGAATLGPVGALLSVLPGTIGMGARSVANRMSSNELKSLDSMIRSRSPLGTSNVYSPSIQPDLVLNSMLASELGGPQEQQTPYLLKGR